VVGSVAAGTPVPGETAAGAGWRSKSSVMFPTLPRISGPILNLSWKLAVNRFVRKLAVDRQPDPETRPLARL
jgi:hypothetical protein